MDDEIVLNSDMMDVVAKEGLSVASEDAKKDWHYMADAVRQNPKAFSHVHKDLKDDPKWFNMFNTICKGFDHHQKVVAGEIKKKYVSMEKQQVNMEKQLDWIVNWVHHNNAHVKKHCKQYLNSKSLPLSVKIFIAEQTGNPNWANRLYQTNGKYFQPSLAFFTKNITSGHQAVGGGVERQLKILRNKALFDSSTSLAILKV